MTELDEIRSILREVAVSQQQSSERLDRIEQIVESNARAIEANSNAMAELREIQNADRAEFRASLRSEVEDLVGMITLMAEQAEQDRVEFRATVQGILDALTRRFSGNGHGDTDP
ncbi:MAG: hypothetical protein NW224_00245 [Leptolyngbyaceae cyanobacterium bins.302]|nr:hypothetical protein [Leptolyngbyaceae cyanobacterium bins.302]